MGKAWYAVVRGRVPGLYSDWTSTNAQVDKFPNARYKGFDTREEASSWLALYNGTTPVRSSAPSSPFASPPQTPSSTGGAGATAKRGGSSGISEHFTGTVSSRAGVRDADPVARVAPPSLDALTGGFKRAASLVTPPQSSKVKGEDTVDRDGPDETPTKRPAVAPSLPAAEAHSRPYTARFHGVARGNPGPAGAGVVLYDPCGAVMGELEVYVGDGKTSNEACYAALELALQLANEHRIRRIVLETNSELIVKQKDVMQACKLADDAIDNGQLA